jgi:hypothetical protein
MVWQSLVGAGDLDAIDYADNNLANFYPLF